MLLFLFLFLLFILHDLFLWLFLFSHKNIPLFLPFKIMYENEIIVNQDIHFDISSPTSAVVGQEVTAYVCPMREEKGGEGKGVVVGKGVVMYSVTGHDGEELEVVEEVKNEKDGGGAVFRYTPWEGGVFAVNIFYLGSPLARQSVTVSHAFKDLEGGVEVGEGKKWVVGEKVPVRGWVRNLESGRELRAREYKVMVEGPEGTVEEVVKEVGFVTDMAGEYVFKVVVEENEKGEEGGEVGSAPLKVKKLPDSAKFRIIGSVGGVGGTTVLSVADGGGGKKGLVIDWGVVLRVEVEGEGENVEVKKKGGTYQFVVQV